MKKRASKTEMQDHNLRQECSATWGGNRKANDTVAFRVTSGEEAGKAKAPVILQPWPLTEEEEALLCG